MRWVIVGCDRESGRDIEVELDATSEAEALAKASSGCILVAECKLVDGGERPLRPQQRPGEAESEVILLHEKSVSTRKYCVQCHTDVTNIFRIKNAGGQYLCRICAAKLDIDTSAQRPVDQIAKRHRSVWLWVIAGLTAAILAIGGRAYYFISHASSERRAEELYAALNIEADDIARKGDFAAAVEKYDALIALSSREGYANLTPIDSAAASKNQLITRMETSRKLAAAEAQALAEKQQASLVEKEREDRAANEKNIREAEDRASQHREVDAREQAYQNLLARAQAEMQTSQFQTAYMTLKQVLQERPKDPKAIGALSNLSVAIQGSFLFAKTNSIPKRRDRVNAFAISPDGSLLAVATLDDKTLHILNSVDGKELRTTHFDDYVNHLIFSQDGTHVWISKGIQEFCSIKVSTGVIDAKFHHPTAVSGHGGQPLALSHTGKLLISGGSDNSVIWTDDNGVEQRFGNPVNIYDTASGKLAGALLGHTAPVTCFAFSPDEKLIATGSGEVTDPRILLFDKRSGKIASEMRTTAADPDGGFQNCVTAVAFTRDGKRLIAAGDNQVRLFEIGTGRRLLTVPDLGLMSVDVLLTRDDRRAVVRIREENSKTSVRILDISTGQMLQTLRSDVASTKGIEGGSICQTADRKTVFMLEEEGVISTWKSGPSAAWQKEAIAAARFLDPASSADAQTATADASELGWLQNALSGQVEDLEKQRALERKAEQDAIIAEGRRKAAERQAQKEVAEGSPRAVAESVFATSKSQGWDIQQVEFVSYAIGMREYDTLPMDREHLLNVNYQISYGSKGGTLMRQRGSVSMQWQRSSADIASGDSERGHWIPINANVGGRDYPVR